MFTCGRSTGARVDNRIWVFDIATDPANPKLARTIADLGDKSGYLDPTPITRFPAGCSCRPCRIRRTRAARPAWGCTTTRGSSSLRTPCRRRAAVTVTGTTWRYFPTTPPPRQLKPPVEGFGQDVRGTFDRSNGPARREASHRLTGFLIERAGEV